jgi:hypothetical protein
MQPIGDRDSSSVIPNSARTAGDSVTLTDSPAHLPGVDMISKLGRSLSDIGACALLVQCAALPPRRPPEVAIQTTMRSTQQPSRQSARGGVVAQQRRRATVQGALPACARAPADANATIEELVDLVAPHSFLSSRRHAAAIRELDTNVRQKLLPVYPLAVFCRGPRQLHREAPEEAVTRFSLSSPALGFGVFARRGGEAGSADAGSGSGIWPMATPPPVKSRPHTNPWVKT